MSPSPAPLYHAPEPQRPGLLPALAAGAIIAQAVPLLAALLGIVVWKELQHSDMRVKSLTLLMAVLYACGVVMVSVAPVFVRKP